MLVSPTPKNIAQAAAYLKAGEVVAFPTETVYGLGALASSDEAVAKVYALKNRPSINPLIFHCLEYSWIRDLLQAPPMIDTIANMFMPGPLTLILNLTPRPTTPPPKINFSKLATAGLPTIAIRVPQHPVARAILEAVGEPLVAPSANTSGCLSPTKAIHVERFFKDKIKMIVDGGDCDYGMESTILDVTEPTPTILRHGAISHLDLENKTRRTIKISTTLEKIKAPGQMKKHYAPTLPLRINVQTPRRREAFIGFAGRKKCDFNLSPSSDLKEAAANLFKFLHQADDPTKYKSIAVCPIPNVAEGITINDRLERASYQEDQDK